MNNNECEISKYQLMEWTVEITKACFSNNHGNDRYYSDVRGLIETVYSTLKSIDTPPEVLQPIPIGNSPNVPK
jgi:predicted transcriptional regulator